MKTAMQDAIELVKKYDSRKISYNVLLGNLELLLEKEKEQIINAHNEGIWHTEKCFDEGEEYYNQTYNQKIPELLYKDGTPMRKVKLGKEAQELLDEIDNEKKGDLVRLLRWVLKHYSTGTDIDGFFMWENPIGEEFDSLQVVEHYLNQNK